MGLKSILRGGYQALRRLGLGLSAPRLDRHYLGTDIPAPVRALHGALPGLVAEAANRPGMRVLEIGAREVTGAYGLREQLGAATYVGFDFYPGPNVDVVGDAHRLSSYFDEPFDVVFSTAVFEHLAMPWVVAEEIAKVLKVGGLLVIETHFSHGAHERPWNFFQFSDMGLKVLFGGALGFECLEASLQTPIVGRFSHLAPPYLRYRPVTGLYCHAIYLGRKVRERDPDFAWRDLDLDAVVGATRYPEPGA